MIHVHADEYVQQIKHKTGSLTSSGDGNSNVQVQVQCACMQHVLVVYRVCIVLYNTHPVHHQYSIQAIVLCLSNILRI